MWVNVYTTEKKGQSEKNKIQQSKVSKHELQSLFPWKQVLCIECSLTRISDPQPGLA